MPDYFSPVFVTGSSTLTADNYYYGSNTGALFSSVEGERQQKIYGSFDAESFFVNIESNADVTSTNFILRVNGVSSSLVATVTGSGTGIFEDNTNTVSVSASDLLGIFVDKSGAGLVNTRVFGFWLKSPQPLSIVRSSNFGFTTNSTTSYTSIPGQNPASRGSSESNRYKIAVPVACTIKNFSASVAANARITSVVCTLRKNSVDTSAVLTIPGATTGYVEDTSTTVSMAAGDEYSAKIVSSTGGGLINLSLGIEIENDDAGSFTQISAGSMSLASNTSVVRGPCLGGQLTGFSSWTIGTTQVKMRAAAILRKFRLNVYTNTATVGSVFDLEVNGTLGGLSMVIPPVTTGTISDLSTEISVSQGDLINMYSVASAGSGSKLLGWLSYEIDQDIPPPSAIATSGVMWWY